MRLPVQFLTLAMLPSLGFAQDSFVVDPDPGASPVGTAQSLAYTAGTIRVSNTFAGGLDIASPTNATPRWNLRLVPSAGNVLAVGCFERARRFDANGRPGLDFSFGSSGCNESFGRYSIRQIERDGMGNVTRLAVDFAQQCGRYGRATPGKIRFNSTIPTTGAHLRPVTAQTGSFSFSAAPGAIGALAPGGMAAFQLTRQTSDAEGNFDNGVSVSYRGPLPDQSGDGNWDLDFAASGNAQIAPGAYPNATRYPFQATNEDGLAFSYGGSGCNTLAGSFNVSAIEMDGLDPLPNRFSATFEQRCPDGSGPLTSGAIIFESNIVGPTSPPTNNVVFASGFEVVIVEPPAYFVSSCQ